KEEQKSKRQKDLQKIIHINSSYSTKTQILLSLIWPRISAETATCDQCEEKSAFVDLYICTTANTSKLCLTTGTEQITEPKIPVSAYAIAQNGRASVAIPRAIGSRNPNLSRAKDTMLRARATVMHLGRIDTVNDGSRPTRRPTKAVEYKENNVDRITEANERITDPRNPIKMSPAPGFDEIFIMPKMEASP
ncbi:methylisocitrate lyase, partial [Striga asiatica]